MTAVPPGRSALPGRAVLPGRSALLRRLGPATGASTAVGGLALAIGATALVSPARLSSVYGLDPPNGGAGLAWRMFGVRTALIGAAVLAGDPSARRAVLPVQLLDQAVFLHALLTGAVPRRSCLLAMGTSAVLIALSREQLFEPGPTGQASTVGPG